MTGWVYRSERRFHCRIDEDGATGNEQPLTIAKIEWGLIGQGIFKKIGKSTTMIKFRKRCGYERAEKLALQPVGGQVLILTHISRH